MKFKDTKYHPLPTPIGFLIIVQVGGQIPVGGHLNEANGVPGRRILLEDATENDEVEPVLLFNLKEHLIPAHRTSHSASAGDAPASRQLHRHPAGTVCNRPTRATFQVQLASPGQHQCAHQERARGTGSQCC